MLLMGAATFLVSYVFALRGIDPHHDGIMLKTAVDVSRGLALYRDTFTQYGSFVIYLLALFVRLFGETVTALHIAACLGYALSAVALYRLVCRFAPRLVAVVSTLTAIGMAAFYFWNFHPWSSVFALCLSLYAALFCIRFVERRRMGELLCCGLLTAAMFWCRQPAGLLALFVGLYLVGLWAVGFFRFSQLLRALLWFLLGNLLVHGAFLAVILLQGALADWWIQGIQNAFRFAAEPTPETAAKMPDSLFTLYAIGVNDNPGYDWIWRALTHGSLLYLMTLTLLAFVKKKRGGASTELLCAIAFALCGLSGWVQYYPTLCYRHVFWSDYPLFGVAAVALYQGLGLLLGERKKRLLCAVLASALLIGLCGPNLLVRARLGKARLMGGGTGASWHTTEYAEEDTVLRYSREDYPYLNGLYLSERETAFYDGLFDTVAAARALYPEKNIVNTTPNALFSLFSSENAHKYAFAEKADGYPEQTAVVEAYIQQNKPIVLSYRLYDGYEPAARLTAYNGDAFRWEPMYVLLPVEE